MTRRLHSWQAITPGELFQCRRCKLERTTEFFAGVSPRFTAVATRRPGETSWTYGKSKLPLCEIKEQQS
jgi:hypothetical protein